MNRACLAPWLRWLQLTPALIFYLAGCASYDTVGLAEMVDDEDLVDARLNARAGDLDVEVVLLRAEEDSRQYVGIDREEQRILPVYLRIANRGEGPVKIDLSRTMVVTENKGMLFALDVDGAVDRARRGDLANLGWGLGFGLIGAFASGYNTAATNQSIERDFQEKYFKPTLIGAGAEGKGMVFFDVGGLADERVFWLQLHVTDLQTQQVIPTEIDVRSLDRDRTTRKKER